jgi:hypothetical protein
MAAGPTWIRYRPSALRTRRRIGAELDRSPPHTYHTVVQGEARLTAASDSGLEGRRRSRFGVVAFVARG